MPWVSWPNTVGGGALKRKAARSEASSTFEPECVRAVSAER